jgi:tetratricopeptide (TPR) repeat protein
MGRKISHERIAAQTGLRQTVHGMFGGSGKPGPKKAAKPPQLNRSDVLAAADKLRVKGKYKKAVVEYRKLVAQDPADADVHAKMAPLLIKLGEGQEALKSYRAAADVYLQRGFADRAIAMYSQAAAAFPKESSAWERVGRLHFERGRKAEGVKALLTGAAAQIKAKQRPEAEKLLRQALSYEPLHIDANVALCRVLKGSGKKDEARHMLAALAQGIRGPALKKVRAAEFKLFPGFGTFFRWLRS